MVDIFDQIDAPRDVFDEVRSGDIFDDVATQMEPAARPRVTAGAVAREAPGVVADAGRAVGRGVAAVGRGVVGAVGAGVAATTQWSPSEKRERPGPERPGPERPEGLRVEPGPIAAPERPEGWREVEMGPADGGFAGRRPGEPVFDAAAEAELVERNRRGEALFRAFERGDDSGWAREMEGLSPAERAEVERRYGGSMGALRFVERLPAFKALGAAVPGAPGVRGLRRAAQSGARLATVSGVGAAGAGLENAAREALTGFFYGAGMSVAGGAPFASVLPLVKIGMAAGQTPEQAVGNALFIQAIGLAERMGAAQMGRARTDGARQRAGQTPAEHRAAVQARVADLRARMRAGDPAARAELMRMAGFGSAVDAAARGAATAPAADRGLRLTGDVGSGRVATISTGPASSTPAAVPQGRAGPTPAVPLVSTGPAAMPPGPTPEGGRASPSAPPVSALPAEDSPLRRGERGVEAVEPTTAPLPAELIAEVQRMAEVDRSLASLGITESSPAVYAVDALENKVHRGILKAVHSDNQTEARRLAGVMNQIRAWKRDQQSKGVQFSAPILDDVDTSGWPTPPAEVPRVGSAEGEVLQGLETGAKAPAAAAVPAQDANPVRETVKAPDVGEVGGEPPTAAATERDIGPGMARVTPAAGTPERAALDARVEGAEAARDLANDQIAELRKKLERTKRFSKAYEKLKAQIEAKEEALPEAAESDRVRRYLANLEDAAEAPRDEAQAVALRATLRAQRFKLKDVERSWASPQEREQAVRGLAATEAEQEQLKEFIRREAVQSFGATPEEAERAAVDLQAGIWSYPLAEAYSLRETTGKDGRQRVAGLEVVLRQARMGAAQEAAQAELEKMASQMQKAVADDFLKTHEGRLRDRPNIWEYEDQVANIVESARAESKALIEAANKEEAARAVAAAQQKKAEEVYRALAPAEVDAFVAEWEKIVAEARASGHTGRGLQNVLGMNLAALVERTPNVEALVAAAADRGVSLKGIEFVERMKMGKRINDADALTAQFPATGDGIALKPLKAGRPAEAAAAVASDDPTRAVLNGVHFSKKHQAIVATDGTRLLMIPAKVARDKTVLMKATKAQERLLKVKVGGEIEGQYPNFQNVIPAEADLGPARVLDLDAFRRRAMAAEAFVGKRDAAPLAIVDDAAGPGVSVFLNAMKVREGVEALVRSGAKQVVVQVPKAFAENRAAHVPVVFKGDNGAKYVLMPMETGDIPPGLVAHVPFVEGPAAKVAAAKAPAKKKAPTPSPTPPRDVAAEGELARKAGFAAVGASDRRMARVSSWLRRKFSTSGGIGRELFGAVEDYRDALESVKMTARAGRLELTVGGRALFKRYGRPAVLSGIRDVQDGRLSLEQFATQFGVAMDHPAVRALRAQAAASALFREAAEPRSDFLSPAMRETIAENAFYQSRVYERFLMGDDFEPRPEDVGLARAAIRDQLSRRIDAVARRTGRLGRALAEAGGAGPDAALEFLVRGDARVLGDLAPEGVAAAERLRRTYLDLAEMIDGLEASGDAVSAIKNADALERVAQGYVDFYLMRGDAPAEGGASGGGFSVANLQRRIASEAFRALYREIDDPLYRAQMTAEVQGRILAQWALVDRLIGEGEGVVWARQPSARFSERLGDARRPSDKKRWGDLAGRYITPELKAILETPRSVGRAARVGRALWTGPLSLMRGMKLMNVRTAGRNYATNFRYSLASGDMFLPGWLEHFRHGHRVMRGYAQGEPAAVREMGEIVASGAFRPGAATSTQDMEIALSGGRGKVREWAKRFTRAYAYINFPFQYAGYMARTDARTPDSRRMTPEQAKEHVRARYQNRDRVPEIVTDFSRAGGKDYAGFTVDAMRLYGEQARFAGDQVKRGDLGPLIGFILSHALLAATLGELGRRTQRAVANAHRRIRRQHREREYVDMDDSQRTALREFLPEFDRFQPLAITREQDRETKQDFIYVTVMGGNNALPHEDWLAGALQVQGEGGSFWQAMGGHLAQQFSPTMYFDSLARAAVGSDIRGRRAGETGKGLWQAITNPADPELQKVLTDVAWSLGTDFAPMAVAGPARRLMKMSEREAAGQGPEGMFASSVTKEDALASAARLIRTRRIERTDFQAMVRDRLRKPIENLNTSNRMVRGEMMPMLMGAGATATQQRDAATGAAHREAKLNSIRAIMADAERAAPFWMDRMAQNAILTQGGMSQADAMAVLDGIDFGVMPVRPDRRGMLLDSLYGPGR
jgi:hypothetical protein